MNSVSLNLLARLLIPPTKKDDRLTELLRNPESSAPHGWFMYLPPAFNDSLDIRQTTRTLENAKLIVWTQGSGFSFQVGDIIYDSPGGYAEWTQALSEIKIAVQVSAASAATTWAFPAKSKDLSIAPQSTRFPGTVTFDILRPNADRTKLVKVSTQSLTQDAFVKFLITGEGVSND